MATETLSLQEVVDIFKESGDAFERARIKALTVVMLQAEVEAKQNIKRNFIGRNDRTLSGMLLNNTYVGYEREKGEEITGYLGVRDIPYARIHEYGGDIKPVKAQKLWIPVYANAGKMTPREFIQERRQNSDMYLLSDKVAGKWRGYGNTTDRDLIPMFYLVDEVTIPKRPYLTPPLESAQERYPHEFEKQLAKELDK